MKRTSYIYKLNPILEDGVLRVGGRLSRSAMPEESAILAKDLHVSDIILRHVHQQVEHSGCNHMLSNLQLRYWIPGACVAIRKILSKCIVCWQLQASPEHQQMARDEPPFTHVGFDYFEPFQVKQGRSTVKK